VILRLPSPGKDAFWSSYKGSAVAEEIRRVSGGAVVMIGPIPIVVGSDGRTSAAADGSGTDAFWFIMVRSS
jgi:hypothetical protein